MKSGNEKIREEMREAEEEIEGDDAEHDGTGYKSAESIIPLEALEEGSRTRNGDPHQPPPASPLSPTSKRKERRMIEGARNFCSFFLSPVFVQAFVLTFLGEWGDRSQIATIALGAAHVRLSPFFFDRSLNPSFLIRMYTLSL